MRSVGRLPVILYFINGMAPTEAQAEEAAGLKANVRFRNALLVDNAGAEALEECDGVMGDVPPRYQRAFGSAPDDVSGIGALRMIHGDEPGVTSSQAVHLDSRGTGDFVEEDRRRAYKGPAINEDGARPTWPGAEAMATRPNDSAPETVQGSGALAADAKLGISGAAHVRAAAVGMDARSSTASIADAANTGLGNGASGGQERDLWGEGGGSGKSTDKALSEMTRAELNELAAREGVDGADKLDNKGDVIAAIEAKRAA